MAGPPRPRGGPASFAPGDVPMINDNRAGGDPAGGESSDPTDLRRQGNIQLFRTMLGHLGRKEFEQAGTFLAEDIYCDWPFLPVPEMPEVIVGRQPILEFFRAGMQDFDPYDYRISAIHEMKDPDQLIAEYWS